MTAFHLNAAFDLLLDKIMLTDRAVAADWLVPRNEFALWVLIAAIEDPVLLGFPFDDLAFVANRASHIDFLHDRFRVPAFRKVAARIKFSESADFDDHRMSA